MSISFWIIAFFTSILLALFLAIWKRKLEAILSTVVSFISFVISLYMYVYPTIPYNSLSYNGHHYYIYSGDAATWRDALSNCNSRNGYLAVIDDKKENDALFTYMVNMGYDQAFFGLAKTDDGSWGYIYNKDHNSGFEDWGRNKVGQEQPNNEKNGGKENFAELDINMSDGHWNNAEFGKQTYDPKGKKYKNICAYICEWDY